MASFCRQPVLELLGTAVCDTPAHGKEVEEECQGMCPLSCCLELDTVACTLEAILDREGEAPGNGRGHKEPAP